MDSPQGQFAGNTGQPFPGPRRQNTGGSYQDRSPVDGPMPGGPRRQFTNGSNMGYQDNSPMDGPPPGPRRQFTNGSNMGYQDSSPVDGPMPGPRRQFTNGSNISQNRNLVPYPDRAQNNNSPIDRYAQSSSPAEMYAEPPRNFGSQQMPIPSEHMPISPASPPPRNVAGFDFSGNSAPLRGPVPPSNFNNNHMNEHDHDESYELPAELPERANTPRADYPGRSGTPGAELNRQGSQHSQQQQPAYPGYKPYTPEPREPTLPEMMGSEPAHQPPAALMPGGGRGPHNREPPRWGPV